MLAPPRRDAGQEIERLPRRSAPMSEDIEDVRAALRKRFGDNEKEMELMHRGYRDHAAHGHASRSRVPRATSAGAGDRAAGD
jgi:hypothetical protein